MDVLQTLADHIARNEASQAQFARNVSCSESHLSLVLAGKRGLSVPLAKRISDKTNIPVRALVPDKIERAAEVLEAAQ
jgi:antitoxin component HigA of HigAB toxin-antitoxin module